MFDELDDTQEFVPSHAFRTGVLRRLRSNRRRRTALRVGGATCAAAIALPAGYAIYEYRRLDDVHRINIDAVGDGRPEPAIATSATSAASGSVVPEPAGSGVSAPEASTLTPATADAADTSGPSAPEPAPLTSATTFLVVGVDTNEPAGVTGSRSDTLMVVQVDPDNDQLRLLSIPRDLWVQRPGSSTSTRINSLIAVDDPQDLVVTVEQLLDVSVDHYVQIDFEGFKALTELAGGVSVISATPLRDDHTGLDLPANKCVTLTGEQALALVRSRHTEFFDGTTWIEDPRSDFGRIARQQVFLRALGTGLLAELDDPGSIHDFISAAVESIVVDDGFDNAEMLSTAWTVRGIGLEGLRTATVQSTPRTIDGAAVLVASEAHVADAVDFLRGPLSPDAALQPAIDVGGDAAPVSDEPAAQLPVLQGCTP